MSNHSGRPTGAEQRKLGLVTELSIQSTMGPFRRLIDYTTVYPAIVIEALGLLYAEYNARFTHMAEANREWDTDYQYAMFGPDGGAINFAVQVDMLGLPEGFLEAATGMSLDQVKEILRGSIFEIENSMAMYQLLEQVCAPEGEDSFFKVRFRAALQELRERFGKPIAILAVTQAKYDAVLSSEFGKNPGETITDEEVQELSGFDRLFGPEEFRAYIAESGSECGYLLYVRSSDPVAKLKKPGVVVDHPLLGDPEMRRVIKAHSLTFNIDDPEMAPAARINDTKGYMGPMGMAFEIGDSAELFHTDFLAHLSRGRGYNEYTGVRLSDSFVTYLQRHSVDPEMVASGQLALRVKPLQGTYGCYGHDTGTLSNKRFRSELRRSMRDRGRYVVQPEMTTPLVTNETCGTAYGFIDRNFFAWTNGAPVFLGGFRSLMPVEGHEAAKRRNHGSDETVWAQIVA